MERSKRRKLQRDQERAALKRNRRMTNAPKQASNRSKPKRQAWPMNCQKWKR